MKNLKNIKNLILDWLFPESCLICGEIGNTICSLCLSRIKFYKPTDEDKQKTNLKESIDWIKNSLDYRNENLRKIMFSLKYFYTKSVALYLSKICYEDFLNILDNKIEEDYIFIPIPISNKRFKERNYNQSEIILKEIIKRIKENKNIDLEKYIYSDLLLKKKHTVKFSHTHSHYEREELIKDAFYMTEKYLENLKEKSFINKKIIILDDITTTGATFYEARTTLIKAGFKKENIYGYAVAH